MPQAQLAEVALEYECHGDPGRPALVLIRGLGTQLIDWSDSFIAHFVEKGIHVVVFDNRDAGLSSKAVDGYTLDDMASDVVGLLDHLGIAKAHLFGISMGGMIAQLVAVNHPERLASLISVMSSSGHPALPQAKPDIMALLMESAEGATEITHLSARSKAVFGSPGYPEAWPERLAAAERAYARCHCPEGVARQMRAVIADGDRSERLRGVRKPSLVIHDKDDPLIPWQAGAHTAEQLVTADLVLIDGMGHNIPSALETEIAEHVLGFISQQQS